ncbi:MAG: carboxypeptidase regulatory-like domain-containing protein, partial [Acidobacteriota bacterium]
MVKHAIWVLLLAFLLVLIRPCSVHAQMSTGQISGHAKDPTGAVVPNVRVTVASAGIGVTRTGLTNESGYYIVTNLPVGTYEVSGEVAGFKRFVKSGIVLNAGAAIAVDVDLAVGETTERVEVTATLQSVTTDTSQVGRLVGRDQLLELPVGGRSFINLIGMQAGVSHTGNFNDFVYSPYGVGAWTINGSRGYQNLWQIDGVVNVRTRANNFLTGTMSIDAVQEVQVVTAGFKAEHGRNSGSQINFVSKSGTQEYHGALFWYGRNDKFDAREFFALTKPHLRWNNYGWTLGGPIYIPGTWNTDKSRLFFYFNQEWNKRRAGSTSVGWVPPLELREGNLNTPYRPAALAIPVDPLSGTPFPGNIIPRTRFSRNGPAFAKVVPYPTFPDQYVGNNLIRTLLSRNDVRIHMGKVDYNLGRARFTVRLNQTDTWDYSPQNFALDATQDYDRPKKNATVQITSTLNPSTINEFLFGATVDVNKIMPAGKGFDRRSYGIDFPYFFPAAQKLMGEKLPNVSVSGVGSFTGGPYPGKSTGPIYQWRDNFTKILRNHTLKFGVYVEAAQQNDMDSVLVGAAGMNQNGVFWFKASKANPLTTGNAWADMLLGNFDTYEEIGLRAYIPWRSTMYEAFAQDSWKVRPDLTLEYGLRWAYMPPFGSAWGNFQSFNPKFYDFKQAVTVRADGTIVPGSGFLYNGITLPGKEWPKSAIGRLPFAADPESKRLFHDLPKTLTDTHHLWGPRLGFAWDIGGAHQTVLRGGFGLFYDRITCNDWSHPGGVSPLQP